MRIKMLFTTLPTRVLFTAGYDPTLGIAKLDPFYGRLTEELQQWKAVNSIVQGIGWALSIPSPANYAVPAASLPEEA
jgi:hypothetical protein